MSVETSAPVIEPSPPAPRFSRQPPASAAPAKVSDPARALKNMGPGAFLRLHAVADHDDDDLAVPAEPVTDDDELARTCEYQSQATARKAYASTTNEVDAPPVPTLRDPPVGFGDEDAIEVEDPYSEPDAATAAVMAPVRLPTPFPQAPRAGSASLGQSPPPPPARTAPLSPPPAPPRLRSERPARTTEAPRTASGVRAEPGVRRR